MDGEMDGAVVGEEVVGAVVGKEDGDHLMTLFICSSNNVVCPTQLPPQFCIAVARPSTFI